VLTRNPVQPRVVLIGNAAHTLHPVAGQGFNLGLRDVAALAEVIAQSARAGADLGGPAALSDYRVWRGSDQPSTARLTDLLARVFVNPWTPLRLARNAAMLGLDLIPPARHRVAQRFMGVGGRLPRLACGVPLEKADADTESIVIERMQQGSNEGDAGRGAFDLIVVGGGMVGAALARACSGKGLRSR
jgi:2-octaprenyl-6-methoxyphenol hydroxylase